MNKTAYILACLAFGAASMSFTADGAKRAKANVNDLKYSIEDSAIVYPESFEADTQKLLEGWYMKNYTSTDSRYANLGDVETSDSEIRQRLADLPAVIELPFNPVVRNYIDRYTKRGRAQVAGLLGLSNYYMPIFEQALEAQGLPLELKYLPVIESGLDPNAVSRHGATGLWQFMLASANGLGLEVNSLVDERRDPYASSEAAARYLKSLYDTYGDWTLAIAAYNCGPGNVNKAIRRAGGEPSDHDFWSIYSYLSPETRGYVPMFIAANYVMNYYDRHNISPVLPTRPLVTDTVGINTRLHFDQISAILNIPVEELRILNPQYRADIIPGSAQKTYMLTLPGQQVHAFILSEKEILAYNADKYRRRETVLPGGEAVAEETLSPEIDDVYDENLMLTASRPETGDEEIAVAAGAAAGADQKALTTVVHTVAAGETLDQIAQLYGADKAAIKTDNNLRRSAVRVGQQLKIRTSKPEVAAERRETAAASTSKTPAKTTTKAAAASAQTRQQSAAKKQAAKPVTHTVKSGENLTVIAKRHGVTVDQLKKANGITSDKLRPGDKLKVPAKTSKSKSKSTSKKKRRR